VFRNSSIPRWPACGATTASGGPDRGGDAGRAHAREVLAPVYGWFTEGFGTPVLKEAKTLLDELG
jgi:hypothetical protein